MTQQRTFVFKLQATNKGCVELEVRVTWRYRRGHIGADSATMLDSATTSSVLIAP